VDELKRAYDIVKDFSDIIGLFISTRPDCVDEERLDLIQSYKKKYEVWIEYGIQTIHDRSLEMMNRRHTFSQSVEAVRKTAERGIKAAAHIILGLPGESWKDMVKTARMLSRLPVFGVKFHALHVAKDTELESLYDRGEVELMSRGDYVTAACDFLENLRSDCVIFRLISDARDEVLVAPKWINDKARIIREIDDELEARGTRQGILAPGEAGRPSNSIV
jgi:hypothetical protein